jgi:hypothetical protein
MLMKLHVFSSILLIFSVIARAQTPTSDISIETGKETLTLSQPFTIAVVVKNSENRPTITFPEIEGLQKRSASATTTTSTVGGTTVLIQTKVQQYFATREGVYEIPSFTVIVNGTRIKSEGLTVTFGKGQTDEEATELFTEDQHINIEDPSSEAISLVVSANKSSVYIREGFSVQLSLYVAESAPVEMEFYNLDAQLQAILKKLRPQSCWEENLGLDEVIQRTVEIKGKKFTEYRMYQAVIFPLTTRPVIFPSVQLDMLVFDAKNGAESRQRSIRSFFSKSVRVNVRQLPYHPKRDEIAVGEFHAEERLSRHTISAGESVNFTFSISGIGNIAAVNAPELPIIPAFDIYSPDINQVIRRTARQLAGEKTFNYTIVAKKEGNYPLGRLFQWIYFDPRKAQYDTLRSLEAMDIIGSESPAAGIESNTTAGLYDNLEQLDTSGTFINYQKIVRSLINAVILALFIGMIWVFRK